MNTPSFDPKNVEFNVIDRPDHPDFDKVYTAYQKCFPLPTEQESKENFLSILADNAKSGNPGKEMWVYAKDKTTGEVLGANNFDAFPAAKGHGVDGTVLNIYMFVQEEHREQGVFKMLQAETEKLAGSYLREKDASISEQPKLVTFAEQNNPLMMTPAQYIEDSNAAVDQNVRRDVWEKLGFRTAEMRYVQPPLEKGGETCDYLDFVAKPAAGMKTVPAEVMQKHLENFFDQSFPKGTRLGMKALKGTKADLDAAKASGGEIVLSEPGKFKAMMSELSVEKLSKLPAEQQETLIGNLRPDLVEKFYGKGVTIDAAMTSNQAIKQQASAATDNASQSLRAAIASQDVAGIMTAIANGAPVPTSQAFLKLAEANPALAGIPAVASLLAAKQEAPQPPKEVVQATEEPKPVAPQPATATKTAPAMKAPNSAAKPLPAAMQTALAAAAAKIKKTPQVSGGGNTTQPSGVESADDKKLPGSKKGQAGGIG